MISSRVPVIRFIKNENFILIEKKVDDAEQVDQALSDSNSQYVTLVNQSDDENKSKFFKLV